METRRTRSLSPLPGLPAFTLIELLVVIAIIAILAAILFPVFATVRENARQSSTMSNLHNVYVNAKVFAEDEGHFPSSLLGYAETPLSGASAPNPTARPAMAGDPITPMDQVTEYFAINSGSGSPFNRGYLYPQLMKDYRSFLCEDNLVKNNKAAVTAVYWPINTPLGGGSLSNRVQVQWTKTNAGAGTYGDSDLPSNPSYPSYAGTPKQYYVMDSMDIGPTLNQNGKPVDCSGAVTDVANACPELHYSPDWSHKLGAGSDTDSSGNPIVTQLKYKFPPADRTVITYVTHHAALGNPQVLVLLLSGTVRKISPGDAYQHLPLQFQP